MKPYLIYLNLTLDCPDKATRNQVDAARIKALKNAKEQFSNIISTDFKSTEVVVKKEQPIEGALAIEVGEDALDSLLKKITKIDLVQTIDSLFPDAVKEVKETNVQNKLKKFLK